MTLLKKPSISATGRRALSLCLQGFTYYVYPHDGGITEGEQKGNGRKQDSRKIFTLGSANGRKAPANGREMFTENVSR